VDTATGDTAFAATAPDGIANFVGTVGDYSVNISATGTTLARGSAPSLDLDVGIARPGAGASTLQIYYSDGTFGPTAGIFALQTTGPEVGGVVTSSAYIGTTVFSTTTQLASSVDTYPFTVNGTGSLVASSYYVTLEDAITGTAGSVDTIFGVPDGGATVLLLGIALLTVALFAKRTGRLIPC